MLSAGAAEINYVGSPTNVSWNVGSNWEGGVAPGKDDLGVFDLGAGVTTNILIANNTMIGGVKVLSGNLYLGSSTSSAVLFAADANGDAFVHVADGASVVFSNKLYSASNGKVRLRKTGAGSLSSVACYGDQSYYFSALDIEEGSVQSASGKNSIFRQTNTVVRSGALLNFNQYSMTSGNKDGVAVTLEEGATFRVHSDSVDGVHGAGKIEGTGNYSLAMDLGKLGPYRFGGTVARRASDNVQTFVFTFNGQGAYPDEKYGFILTSTNALVNAGRIKFGSGGINPIKFAPGVGRFNFFQMDSKKDAPLVLEDTNGDPVTVAIQCLSVPGTPDGTAKDPTRFPYFGVAGCGNFLLTASGDWRSESLAFTNDCFRNTGWLGTTGLLKLGDQTAGHDPNLTHVSGVKAFSGGRVYYRNYADGTQSGFIENAGAVYLQGPGRLTVQGPVSGSGAYTLTAPAVFANDVTGGAWTVSAATTFGGPVTGGTFTLGAATTFEKPVTDASVTINAPTRFADAVEGGTYAINAKTTFEGPVRTTGDLAVKGEARFEDATHFGSLTATAPVEVLHLVSSEDAKVSLTAGTNLLVAANGGEGWLNSVASDKPYGGEVVFSNGCFHGAYETDAYTSLYLKHPGTLNIAHPFRVVDGEVWVYQYSSGFKAATIGPGGTLIEKDSANRSGGVLTLDGGELKQYLRTSYGHDDIVTSSDKGWAIKVTERGGRISDLTWRARGGGYVRPILTAAVSSGAAAGKASGPFELSFCNKITITHPLALDGDVVLDSGYVGFGSGSDATTALADGSFFGTGDLTLGCVCLNFGELGSDRTPRFAANGQKIRLAGASVFVGRQSSGYTPQTMTFGDGETSPFTRETGGFTALCDYKSGVTSLDGTGVKFYVAGAKAPVDPTTGILRDPVFGCTHIASSGGGHEFVRYGFLTQGADGLLAEDLSVYTEGVEGGATTVARLSVANTNLATDAQVAALNLDARTLTIAKGATLKVGDDSTAYPAVVLTRVTKGWNAEIRYGSVSGAGTLDFGKSEGLIVAGRATCQNGAAWINATIAGEGGLSIGGTTVLEKNCGKLSLGGANTYTGGTYIDGVTVEAASAGAFSSGAVHIRGGDYNGGRVRFVTAATYANEWFVRGIGTYLYEASGLEPGCLVFCADATLAGPVHVARSARFSTSPAEAAMSMEYGAHASGTGTFAGEISGGEVQVLANFPSGVAKKPIVFTHANSYTGGTIVAMMELVLRGDGDCGTGKVTLANGGTLSFENTAEKDFPNILEGKGTVKLAGSAPVHFTGTVKKESWCDLRLDLAGTAPVFTEAPVFATVTNTTVKVAKMTLRGDMTLDPSSYAYLDPNVRLTVDGGTVDLNGGTLAVERAIRRNGGRFVNGTVAESNPRKGVVVFLK